MKTQHFSKSMITCAAMFATLGPVSAAPPLPKYKVINYDLAAGETSQSYKLPANKAVSVTGTQLTVGYRGVAQATLLRIPGSFIEWVGLESTASAAITEGFSSTAGTHILYLDYSHQVDIRVNNADSIVIHNGSTGTRTGQVVLSYIK